MKKLYIILLCLSMVLGLSPISALAATSWPANVSIEAEGGIVMDADTGAVLYGKNIHISYFPASITKILTALIVIERCNLDETVTFSHNAVYNVEANSTSAGLDEGDVLSVRDCLYTLLLKSANEVANALAEHVAGTTEDFAVLMNEKAASLGCVDSHFDNPSGLNDPDHYTSAYDMALIAQAALHNPTFVEIDSTLYYDIPVTKRNPEGARIYPGHKMIKKNSSEYYSGAFGGKTGYTSLAGNTLVTFAKKDGLTLISVILNGHQTHYSDTRKLLDFGFNNFQSVVAADYDRTYTAVSNDMKIAGLSSSDLAGLTLDKDSKVTIPKGSDFSEVSSTISYDLTSADPKGTLAKIQYSYGERKIGSSYLSLQTSNTTDFSVPATTIPAITGITLESTEASKQPDSVQKTFRITSVLWTIFWVVLILGILITAIVLFKLHQEKKEAAARAIRRARRQQRFEDSTYSSSDFDLLMAQRHSLDPTKRRHRKTRHKSSFFK